MDHRLDTKEEFSVVRRARSFSRAGRGLLLFLKTTPNAWIQSVFLIVGIVLGIYFNISRIEWILFILAAGSVFAAEAFNTAIEIDINLTSPEFHPYARDTKDVAAGAVLITACAAFLVGAFIFVPYILVSLSEL